MKKVIIGIVVFLIVGSLGVFFVLERIGDFMLDSMIDSEYEQAPVPIESKPAGTPEPTPENTPAVASVSTPDQKPNSTPTAMPDAAPEPTRTPEAKPIEKATPTPAPEPTPSQTPKPTPTPIPVEQIKEIKDNVTPVDKASAASLVLSNLTAKDIAILQGFLSGGLTPEEKAEAVKIAYARFTPEEIDIIKDMYQKYMEEQNNEPDE